MHVTVLPGLMPPPASVRRGLQHLGEHLEVRGERTAALFEPTTPTTTTTTTYPPTLGTPTPHHHPQGSVTATALLGRRACRLAPTSLLLSNSQSAKPGDLLANCIGETG